MRRSFAAACDVAEHSSFQLLATNLLFIICWAAAAGVSAGGQMMRRSQRQKCAPAKGTTSQRGPRTEETHSSNKLPSLDEPSIGGRAGCSSRDGDGERNQMALLWRETPAKKNLVSLALSMSAAGAKQRTFGLMFHFTGGSLLDGRRFGQKRRKMLQL